MKKKAAFLVGSLITAGMQIPSSDAKAGIFNASHLDNDQPATVWNFKEDRNFTLAGHRSHSSHGSHRSSSGGGGYTPRPSPSPSYSPPPVKKYNNSNDSSGSSGNYNSSTGGSDSTPATSILPQSPATSPKVTKINGNSKAFQVLVMQVQTALFALGFYNGTIDGLAGSETSAAISIYQLKNDVPVTGRLSDSLLDNLNIDTILIEQQTNE